MKWFVGVLLPIGCVLVYFHWVLGVLVVVAAAWAVPMAVKEIHGQWHSSGGAHTRRGP